MYSFCQGKSLLLKSEFGFFNFTDSLPDSVDKIYGKGAKSLKGTTQFQSILVIQLPTQIGREPPLLSLDIINNRGILGVRLTGIGSIFSSGIETPLLDLICKRKDRDLGGRCFYASAEL